MPDKRKPITVNTPPAESLRKVRFEVYGVELLEKEVKLNGHNGRIYLPPNWIGRKVKIIRQS